jgi:hypothetical protein
MAGSISQVHRTVRVLRCNAEQVARMIAVLGILAGLGAGAILPTWFTVWPKDYKATDALLCWLALLFFMAAGGVMVGYLVGHFVAFLLNLMMALVGGIEIEVE